MNIGEEICGEWLRHVKSCEFIQYNLKTPDVQGEIDVIGINLDKKIVYACEVAIHLVTGMQYVKDKRPDNVPRLTAKFRKDIAYVRKAFHGYEHVFMLWSPVVKNQRSGAKYNQVKDVERIVATIQSELGVTIQSVINETFQEKLDALRKAAAHETQELDSSVVRFLQVEEHLKKHLKRLQSFDREGSPNTRGIRLQDGGLLEVTMRPMADGTRLAVQHHLHEVILGRAAELVREQALQLPELGPALPSEDEKGWFDVPGMYGGFAFWWEGEGEAGKLIVESWCRVVEGSGQRHEVTASGSTLVAEGFV
jgi:hypothetical protein